VAIYTGAKALSRWPINDESTLTLPLQWHAAMRLKYITAQSIAGRHGTHESSKHFSVFYFIFIRARIWEVLEVPSSSLLRRYSQQTPADPAI
jgi:hypothetical protein